MNPYNIFKYIPLSLLRALAKVIAKTMMWMPNLNIHNTIKRNLLIAHPNLTEAERLSLHKGIVYNQALTSVESVKSWAMPPEWSLNQLKDIHHIKVLTNGLKNPNGMLAIVPHLGTWEMMNAWLNTKGSPTIMYKPVKGKITNEFVLQGRQRLNSTLVPTDATGVMAVFKALKSGGFSVILPDHVPDPSGGVVVPFFGIDTLSSTLSPKLASKTKCALVGLACIRRADNRGFDVYCYDLNNPELYNTDMHIATAALNNAMQSMIEKFPEHYMWGYRRFKHVPGIDDVYNIDIQQLKTNIHQLYHQHQQIQNNQ